MAKLWHVLIHSHELLFGSEEMRVHLMKQSHKHHTRFDLITPTAKAPSHLLFSPSPLTVVTNTGAIKNGKLNFNPRDLMFITAEINSKHILPNLFVLILVSVIEKFIKINYPSAWYTSTASENLLASYWTNNCHNQFYENTRAIPIMWEHFLILQITFIKWMYLVYPVPCMCNWVTHGMRVNTGMCISRIPAKTQMDSCKLLGHSSAHRTPSSLPCDFFRHVFPVTSKKKSFLYLNTPTNQFNDRDQWGGTADYMFHWNEWRRKRGGVRQLHMVESTFRRVIWFWINELIMMY